MKPREQKKEVKTRKDSVDPILSDICEAVQAIKYGSVQIHIQDGRVVQIDKINKIRM